ncbi:uncharacterized protein LOC126908164 [Daktulosphaira vitifoliae]|uniref:uncharacterized protein LOC126908164 n=1 Tax=Daktulosphaira vitifoliae TaxID=58002 RepID=UPI0021A9A217|nr:uncharacterized protein LOC126908164 [Daktulosphaira vitifoliae]
MFSLKILTFSFLLYSVILYTNAKMGTKKTIEQLDLILQFSGWKNLSDINLIKFYSNTHYLQNMIETPTHFNKCNQKIRTLTIYLGCTYAKVMQNLYSVISNVIRHSKRKIYEEKDLINGCIFTDELIKLISLYIVPLATLLKGAMDAFDLLHDTPWNNIEKYDYMVSPTLEKIENIHDYLKKLILSHNDISTYTGALETIDKFFKIKMTNLNKDCVHYCEFVPVKTNLWKEWNHEYKTIFGHAINLVFFKFLTKKMQNYIQTVITEKYFHLGFKFDPITGETILPTPMDPIELDLELRVPYQHLPSPILIGTQ